MDQVKVYLGVAKKHHFWILAAIVVLTSVVVWMKASGALATRYEADKNTITSAEKAVQGASAPDNANPQFTEKIGGLHEDLKKRVFAAWQQLYERQVALFIWPPLELNPTVDLNRLRPDEPIPDYVRIFYNEKVVRPLWEEILEQANIRRPKTKADEAETADGENRAVEYEGLVVWKPERREAIVSRYFTQDAAPSTARVRLIQEDAWLFESLIKVIDSVNVGATDSLKAPVKEILTLDIAQWAIDASLESGAAIWTPDKANAVVPGGAGGAMGMGGMGMAGAAAAAAGGAMPEGGAAGAAMAAMTGGGGAANNDNDWLEGRYLDEKGQPLKAGDPQPFAEFKQMFVYMKFVMDQRRIPDLIAACANADLPIETRQVRVQMLQADSGASAGGGFGGGMGGGTPMGMGGPAMGGSAMGGPMGDPGMGGSAMGGPGMGGSAMGGPGMGGPGMGGPGMGGMGMGGMGMGGMGMGGMGMGGMGMGGMELLDGGVETTVYDALVELSGVIYLYDPPDITKLGTGAAGSPETRSFGVPTTRVKVPGTSMGGAGGAMGGPGMGGPGMGGGPMGR